MATIGSSIRISGDLVAQEDLTIQGEVTGRIAMRSGTLIVGPNATIVADIYAPKVEIFGTVKGDIFAMASVYVRSEGRVVGKVTSPRVTLEDGAKFKGSIEMSAAAVDEGFQAADKDNIRTARPRNDVLFAVDPGNASARELGEYLSELSVLYRMLGGSGIKFEAAHGPPPAQQVSSHEESVGELSSQRRARG